jgi:hypothetical protein
VTQSTFPPAGTRPPYGQPYGRPGFPAPGAPFGQPVPAFGQPAPPFGYQQPPKRKAGLIVGSLIAAAIVIGGLVVGAIFLFGPKSINRADAEKQVTAAAEQLIGVAPQDLSCPADVEVRAGGTFTCTASVEGQPVSFTVTQKDDQGTVEITTDNAFVAVAAVQDDISAQVEQAAQVTVTTTCDAGGRTVLVDPAGTQLSCTVSNAHDSSRSVDVVVTVASDGSVTIESSNA